MEIEYDTLTFQQLRELCRIRKIKMGGLIDREILIQRLLEKDEQTENCLVCGVCKEDCHDTFEECGHICCAVCTRQDEESFYTCGVCGIRVKMSADMMEHLYTIQNSNFY